MVQSDPDEPEGRGRQSSAWYGTFLAAIGIAGLVIVAAVDGPPVRYTVLVALLSFVGGMLQVAVARDVLPTDIGSARLRRGWRLGRVAIAAPAFVVGILTVAKTRWEIGDLILPVFALQALLAAIDDIVGAPRRRSP